MVAPVALGCPGSGGSDSTGGSSGSSDGSSTSASGSGRVDTSTGPTDSPADFQCSSLPVAAIDATYESPLELMGLNPDAEYQISVPAPPSGLAYDPLTGTLAGIPQGAPGTSTFDVTIQNLSVPGSASVDVECSLDVNPRLTLQLPLGTAMGCVSPDDSILDVVVAGTGDQTPLRCDVTGGSGNGRIPEGIGVDQDTCQIVGSINEDRLGTWVFMVQAVQSGVELFVPYCITNDQPQGYDITATYNGMSDVALLPIVELYDPEAPFELGGDGDPRYEITSASICGAACFYRYSFLRTNAPIEDNGFGLEPDGLVLDPMGEAIGFFHELRISGPAVPAEFQQRPWVLSVRAEYCITDQADGCADVEAEGDGALEFGIIMIPSDG